MASCVCIYDEQHSKLYLVTTQTNVSETDVKDRLRTSLHEYCLPNSIVFVERLPMTNHGNC
jgi:acyl-coenzyme A synthetase/AMP-(fatty) acid ligase